MTNNVIQFGKPTENGQTENAHKTELLDSIANAQAFLETHKDRLDYFVLGVSLDSAGEKEMGEFHLFTSRITVAEFALTVAILNKSLQRNI